MRSLFWKTAFGLAVGLLVLIARPCAAQMPLGTYTDHEVGPSSITVWADTSGMRLTWYRRDVVRVDLLPSPSTTHDSSLAVHRGPQTLALNVQADAEAIRVSSPGLTARIQKDPVRLRIASSEGRTLVEEPAAAGVTADGERRRAQFRLSSDTRFYGTGQRGVGLDLRGEQFRSYNEQHFGYHQPPKTMNINVPLLLTSQGYALLFDDPHPGRFDLGAEDPSRFWYEAEGGELSYFVLEGTSMAEQLEAYTWLTGRPPMPPKWGLGYLQSKYGYRSAEAARSTVSRLRAEDIPADGLILDLYWFERMGDLNWNEKAFPNPSAMVEDFEDQGIKTLLITEPYFTESSTWFSDMLADGAPRPAQTSSGEPYRLGGWWSCGCDALLADFTHGPTRDWWTDRYAEILDSGVHGLWTDLGEPEAHPSDMQHAAGPADAVHNVYNLLWARTVQETFREQRPNRRVVNLTRSGYAGIQRYGVFTWSADVGRSFTGLAAQRALMLNSSLSGLYYHSSDLGGFVGETSPELYARWMQMGTFSPVTRPHGIDNQPTEPWGFGESVLDISRRYVQLRYRLLPYLYTMAHRAHDRGMPIVRPLFFENPDASRFADNDEAYLFGDSFLVAPVVRSGKREKAVPLPEGTWINYWTDEAVDGGTTVTVDAPLERLPLFVRAGAIVPMRPEAPDYVGRSVADTLQLSVYPGETPSRFTLYEDDGYTRDYEQGRSAATTFERQRVRRDTTAEVRTLTMGATQGAFEGMPTERTYHVVFHRAASPQRVTVDDRVLAARGTPSELREAGTGYAYDAEAERLHVRATAGVRTEHQVRAHLGSGPIAAQSRPVRADGTVDFPLPGVQLSFAGVNNPDTVTVEHFGEAPSSVGDVGGRVGDDRFVAAAGAPFSFDRVTLHLAARRLRRIEDPSRVAFYRRSAPGTGSFSALETTLDDNGTPDDPSDDTLSVQSEALGEFVPVVREAASLELARFDATVEDEGVVVSWRPDTDRTRSYRVERTRDRDAWTEVGIVGAPSDGQTYRFIDRDVPYGADSLAYRLRQSRADGAPRRSRVVAVDRSVQSVEFRGPAPNPARGVTTLRYAVPERTPVTLRLYDVLGRQVRTIVDRELVGRHADRIDVSDLSSGTYFLRLKAGDTIRTERMTVVR